MMTYTMKQRRRFLKHLGYSGLTLLFPPALSMANTNTQPEKRPTQSQQPQNSVILIELKGGNDGLNTLIPFADPAYQRLRPHLAVNENDMIKLDDKVAMHPALKPLEFLWYEKELAWIQGVGYEHPNRSHFRSIDIWDTGSDSTHYLDEGWIARHFQKTHQRGISINSDLGPLEGDDFTAIAMKNPEQYLKQAKHIRTLIAEKRNTALNHLLSVQAEINSSTDLLLDRLSNTPAPDMAFPKTAFGNHLSTAFSLITSDINVPVYKVSLSGFDTHIQQKKKHAKLLKTLADGIDALAHNLKISGHWDKTLLMTYSEFGRRAKENANQGTDHGTAAPHLVTGGSIKGGLYGTYPSLNQLDSRGDLKFSIDFKAVYATIIQDWWGKEQPHSTLPFIRVKSDTTKNNYQS